MVTLQWRIFLFMGAALFSLAGRVAVVLGGSSGLGHTVALGLADAGADVVVSARRREMVEKTAAEIEAKGRKSLRVTSDVKDKASLVSVREAVLKAFGKVDILVNAAGIIRKLPTLEMKEEDWDEVVSTNLKGTLLGCQVFGEHMLQRGSGRVINI